MKNIALLAVALTAPIAWSAPAPAHADPLRDHPGHWMGDLKLPNGAVLKIGAEIYLRADGTPWASVASPDQGAYDIPVKRMRAEPGDAVVLDIDIATLKLTWVQDRFHGEWMQGAALPLELRRVDAFPARSRSQAPRPPFPYREELLSIASKEGVTLGATLTLPEAQAHPDVVVLIAGSGPQTRHVHVFGHRVFDVMADYLARRGIAVLRYDKRGVGRSTGDYHGHTLPDLEHDAQAAVAMLAARKQFGKIGLLGHSEGAMIAAAVAARNPQAVDFVVALGGPGMSGFDLALLQDRWAAQDAGATPAEAEAVERFARKYYETVLATPDGAPRLAALKALHAGLPRTTSDLIERMNQGALVPEEAAKSFLPVLLGTDARVDWSRVRSPVLVLGGSLDRQVPAAQNVAGIVRALEAGGNRRVESAVLPSLNHGFQTAVTGKDDEYARIDETIAPVVLQTVADFVRAQRPPSP